MARSSECTEQYAQKVLDRGPHCQRRLITTVRHSGVWCLYATGILECHWNGSTHDWRLGLVALQIPPPKKIVKPFLACFQQRDLQSTRWVVKHSSMPCLKM